MKCEKSSGSFAKKASTNHNKTGCSLISGSTSLLRLLYRVLTSRVTTSDDNRNGKQVWGEAVSILRKLALPRSEVVCSTKWILHQSLAIRPGISFHFCLLSQGELDGSMKEHQESASRFDGWSEVV